MQKNKLNRKFRLFQFVSIFFFLSPVTAQQMLPMAGIWEGKLQAGAVPMRLVFHLLADSSGKFSVSMDSPDQGAKDIRGNGVIIQGDSIYLQFSNIHGSYAGVIVNSKFIRGSWIQGNSYSMNIAHTEKASVLNRPQEPRPPFPYLSKEVSYTNSDSSIRFAATLTIPQGPGPFPALLMITGSGAQNRDEEILGHKPFAVIADYLTRKGFIVLRADDRGVGGTTGDFAHSTSLDFAQDANTGINFLLSLPEVDKKKIGMIGHSEGGMIAPMVAASNKQVDFIILLAGPGEPIISLMQEQNAAVLRSAGVKEEAVQSFSSFYPSMIQAIISAENAGDARNNLHLALEHWKDTAQKNFVLATTGIYDSASQDKYQSAMVSAIYTPWFRYFLKFDPRIYLEKLHCKILALNGSKDIQVVSASNLQSIRIALAKSKAKNIQVEELPGLNHLFQHCKRCTLDEYGQLEETFSPEALTIIGNWLDKNVR